MESNHFDDICPLYDHQVPGAVEQLLAEPMFQKVLSVLFPDVPSDAIRMQFRSIRSVTDFQLKIDHPFLKKLEKLSTNGVTADGTDNLDPDKRYLYISNHRDIVLDSAYLCILLVDLGMDTVEIAIGDNLLIYPWIETLVRLNKSFIVRRGVSGRGQLEASQHLSRYIRYALDGKKESVWLAQRQGRAKDSDDRTQESLLKMLNMSGEKSIPENLSELNICPLAISYEYDPCDFLKAKEFQLKRDDPEYKKTSTDDLLSMQTGIMGFKGRIVYRFGKSISDRLKSMPQLPRGEQFAAIAHLIDKQIHANFEIFDTNKIAYDLLWPEKPVGGYAVEAKNAFEAYLAKQLAKINLPEKDEPYLRERMLEMYANPLVNHLEALK
jgi:hypothetical protein